MGSIDDDFGELYADVELQATSAIRNDLGFEVNAKKAEKNEVDDDAEDDDDDVEEDDDDDDFDVVVNDDDFDAKNGGGGGEGDGGGGGNEFNRGGLGRVRVENGEMEQSGCERATLGLGNVSNMQYKYIRQYGSALTSNQKSVTFGGDDRKDVGYIQHGKSNLVRVGPSYAGYAPALGEPGNGFWLPWYRTILDVDIDTFASKPWTLPGADITDYFNFGFDEESWKRYCQLMGQRRQQTFQNQFNENSRTKLENEAAGCENIKAEVNGCERTTSLFSEFSNGEFNRQVGRPILVEDSNVERLPSMSARGPRYRDSDVVIEITVQDSERSSNVGEENSDEVTKTECKISEDGCGIENEGPNEMGMELEENISSPRASSELKRSCESATVSSHMLQASSTQEKTVNLESDALESGEVTVISKEHAGAVHTPNTSMKDADRNSTETNPCVADIDLSYSDHLQSSPTPSDSDDNSNASVGGHRHSFRIEVGRSSSDSVMDERQVLEDNHYSSIKNQRDAFSIKSTGGRYRSRARSPIEEDRKHFRRRIQKHSELDSYSIEDDNCLVKIEGDFFRRKHLKDHHHRNIERPHGTFDDDDWSSFKEKKSSLGYHEKLFVEKQSQGSRMREPHYQDPWKSKDERDLHFPRERDEEFFWERKMQRMYESVEEEWYLHERECAARDEKLKQYMKPHSSLKHSSLVDRERWNSRSDYYDFPKHHLPLEYSHSDTPPLDRYARSYPSNDLEEEYLYSDHEYDRSLQHFEKEVARSDRVDQYLENPSLDLDYSCHNRIDDVHSNWPRSPHDYHDRHPSYAERRHHFTVERYGVDDGSMVRKYRRCDRYISPLKRRDDRWQLCDRNDAYGGEDNVRYHEDAYFSEKMPSRSNGMNSVEEGQFSKCFNDSYSEKIDDSFEGGARHKWDRVKGGFGHGGMNMHAQSMKYKQRLVKVGGGKSCDVSSPLPTRVELKHNASWCKDSMVPRDVVGERKIVLLGCDCKFMLYRNFKLTGKRTKSGHDNKGHPLSIANRSSQKQQKWQPQPNRPKVFNAQTFQNKLFAMKPDLASDVEGGQIPTKGKKSGDLAHNASLLYNENRILETIAKMEKRRERFKEPILVKNDTGSDPKPDDTVAVTTEPKQQRPARKRRWGGN